jgi:hypothetical protein
MHELAKLEFNAEVILVAGKSYRAGKSTVSGVRLPHFGLLRAVT